MYVYVYIYRDTYVYTYIYFVINYIINDIVIRCKQAIFSDLFHGEQLLANIIDN